MAYPISDVTRRIVYSGSAGVGPYSFSFEVLEQTDVAVYKNTTLLTLTTDYTVTINVDGTGSVTLVSAATASDQITLVGDRAVARSTDFVTGGDLFANSLNDEFDSLVIFAQQIKETADRGLKAAITDPTDVNMTLPAKADRKGKVLAFDSTTGDPVSGPALDSMITVIAQSANINTVADNIADVNTVATNITNVNNVGGSIANVNTVAGSDANIATVATNIANINTVATDISQVITTANDLNEAISEIDTVANNIASVQTVGDNIADVNTVAGISGNVTTVAGISANVTAVAGNATNINAVAADATDIGVVSTNITNVNTVAGVSANVTTVAGISANVTTVAGVSADVTTVAGVSGNVTTVAGVAGNVTTVAGISADVSTVAADSADIQLLADNIATISAKVNKTSDTGSAVIPAGTEAQRDGAPSSGYLRFNSDSGSFEGYDGSAWGAIGGGGGATGAGGDAVFYENGQTVTTSYTLTAGSNAMSTGPITVNSGVTVTVPSGSRWVVL